MQLNGLIAAPFSTMNEDGSLNLAVVEKYASKLKQEGINGVFVCGTTGESYSLTLEERKMLLTEWIKFKEEGFEIIAHVGAPSYFQSAELARHASDAGVSAISVMGPSFFQPSQAEELVGFCSKIAQEAPDIPFYYYHIPSMSGVHVSMKSFLELASVSIPNLHGIKFTHKDFMEMQQCMMVENGRFEILLGYDEALLGGLAFGLKAAIGSTYNYMGPVYTQLISYFNSGQLHAANLMQRYSVKIIEVLFKYRGPVVAGKAIQSLCGIESGPCRLPLKTLGAEEIDSLLKELDALNFFEIIKDPKSMIPTGSSL